MAIDMEWAWEQMKAAGTLHPVAVDVEKLLTTWNKLNHTEVSAASVLDTFNSLARGHAIVVDSDDVEEVWVQARPGMLVMGDRIRVRADAFAGPSGTRYNGRAGVIVGIRYGNIYVKFDDEVLRDASLSVHFKPSDLEKRVR